MTLPTMMLPLAFNRPSSAASRCSAVSHAPPRCEPVSELIACVLDQRTELRPNSTASRANPYAENHAGMLGVNAQVARVPVASSRAASLESEAAYAPESRTVVEAS
jgi:hypothetical protein